MSIQINSLLYYYSRNYPVFQELEAIAKILNLFRVKQVERK
ncbi:MULTISPECIES: hypothetical protein [Microcystis]|uniref:Uncharacterized protein n=1 Tax=Microcystis aeruginosa NIES-4285 TaxID=2497681 RepID=A0A402DF24_MICAE|nr:MULTISPECIES: hypothetical protein [Microcystis]MDJ0526278.1 hypothetical protein [Microcystis sp. M53600_WE12]MDJ0540916.1 hypothetical protein [Microcystis sp. M53603_WE2]MDJ0603543.1 hypothetical protein [Microcystis sp. M53602_WE12]GCE60787.1 hypothetical protein MiAbB_02711 [Microcystis aeruginosa NIES-4285]